MFPKFLDRSQRRSEHWCLLRTVVYAWMRRIYRLAVYKYRGFKFLNDQLSSVHPPGLLLVKLLSNSYLKGCLPCTCGVLFCIVRTVNVNITMLIKSLFTFIWLRLMLVEKLICMIASYVVEIAWKACFRNERSFANYATMGKILKTL